MKIKLIDDLNMEVNLSLIIRKSEILILDDKTDKELITVSVERMLAYPDLEVEITTENYYLSANVSDPVYAVGHKHCTVGFIRESIEKL